jgi:hypothetical protein
MSKQQIPTGKNIESKNDEIKMSKRKMSKRKICELKARTCEGIKCNSSNK